MRLVFAAVTVSAVSVGIGAVGADTTDQEQQAARLAAIRQKLQFDRKVVAAVAGWKRSFHRAMKLYVEEISQDVPLGPENRRYLEIAATGVVARFVPKWTDAVTVRLAAIEDEARRDSILSTIFDEDDLEAIQWLVGNWRLIQIMQRDPVWQRALKKVTTDEQFRQISNRAEVRSAREHRILEDWVMDRLDHEYLLSEKQADRLRALIARQLDDPKIPVVEELYGQVFTLTWAYRVPVDQVTDVLTPVQLELWKKRRALFVEFGEELWPESLSVREWFDPSYPDGEASVNEASSGGNASDSGTADVPAGKD